MQPDETVQCAVLVLPMSYPVTVPKGSPHVRHSRHARQGRSTPHAVRLYDIPIVMLHGMFARVRASSNSLALGPLCGGTSGALDWHLSPWHRGGTLDWHLPPFGIAAVPWTGTAPLLASRRYLGLAPPPFWHRGGTLDWHRPPFGIAVSRHLGVRE